MQYIVNRKTVIGGHPYEPGEELKPEHGGKVPNLLRLGHIDEPELKPKQEEPEPEPPKGDEKPGKRK